MRCMMGGLTVLLVTALCGCTASQAEAEAHIEKFVSGIEELNTTLATVKDRASANAATAKVKEITARLIDLIENDKKVTTSTKTALENKFNARIEAAVQQMDRETNRVSNVDGGDEILAIIQGIGKAMLKNSKK